METQANNQEKFFGLLEVVRKIAIAWCSREGLDEGIWKKDNSFFEEKMREYFAIDAFLEDWNEERCFNLIGNVCRSEKHEKFCSELKMSSTNNELIDRLRISKEQLNRAGERLEQLRQQIQVQIKTENVCGNDFVNSEENLSELWIHLHNAIHDDDVVGVDLTKLTDLSDQGPIKGRKGGSRRSISSKQPNNRISKDKKELIGLTGEIYAFRALKKIHGNVGPANWISGNSRYKYPKNITQDGYGCDFVVEESGKIYYVEVKSSQNDDKVVQLGSSEVELAIKKANKTEEEFVILHVKNALDKIPNVQLLPNPYSNRYKDMYHFEEAGFRVWYKDSK